MTLHKPTIAQAYHCTCPVWDSGVPSPTVLWSISGVKGSTDHSRVHTTRCGTSITTTTPCAVLTVHKTFTMMDDKVQTILLIIAESEHYRRKHGYSVITVTLMQPLQMVHYYRITSNLTDTRKIIILANVRYN